MRSQNLKEHVATSDGRNERGQQFAHTKAPEVAYGKTLMPDPFVFNFKLSPGGAVKRKVRLAALLQKKNVPCVSLTLLYQPDSEQRCRSTQQCCQYYQYLDATRQSDAFTLPCAASYPRHVRGTSGANKANHGCPIAPQADRSKLGILARLLRRSILVPGPIQLRNLQGCASADYKRTTSYYCN